MSVDSIVEDVVKGNYVPLLDAFIKHYKANTISSDECTDLSRTVNKALRSKGFDDSELFFIYTLTTYAWEASDITDLEYGSGTGWELVQIDLNDQKTLDSIVNGEIELKKITIFAEAQEFLKKGERSKYSEMKKEPDFYLKKVVKGKEKGPHLKKENIDIKIINRDAREYTTMESGQGSGFILDQKDLKKPLTLKEAVQKAAGWESYADTIGGRAKIYHIPSKTIFSWRNYISLIEDQKPDSEYMFDHLSSIGVPENKLTIISRFMEDIDPANLNLTSTSTFTGIVIDFDKDLGGGNFHHMFSKIGNKFQVLKREYEYLQKATNYQLLRPIKPIVFMFYGSEDSTFSSLTTFDVKHNLQMVSSEDFAAYNAKKEEMIERLAIAIGKNYSELLKNPIVIDAFNVALENTLMISHRLDPEFNMTSTEFPELVASVDKLDYWLCSQKAHQDLVSELKTHLELYNLAIHMLLDRDNTPTVLGNPDRTRENVFGNDCLRISGDDGLVMPLAPEYILGSMGVTDVKLLQTAYSFFRQELAQETVVLASPDELNKGIKLVGFTKAMRMAAYKIQQGERPDNYMNLVREFGSMLH